MTITNEKSRKQPVLDPLAQPLAKDEFLTWLGEEIEENDSFLSTSYDMCTLETTITNIQIDEDNMIDKSM